MYNPYKDFFRQVVITLIISFIAATTVFTCLGTAIGYLHGQNTMFRKYDQFLPMLTKVNDNLMYIHRNAPYSMDEK